MVGFTIDTSSIERTRDTLNQTKSAAANAASGMRDVGTASDQLNRTVAQLAAQQKQMNDFLQSGNVHVTSYTDSLLKMATAGAALYAAYRGMSDAIGLINRGMEDQLSAMGRLRTGLADIATYGGNAFQFVNDKAVAAQKSMSDVARAVGSTGAQLATFAQQMAPTGASSQSVQSGFATLTYNLAHPATPQGSLAGQTLASYGVSGRGSPDEVAAQFMDALRKTQAGPERTQAAERVFGPGGADIINDTIAGLAKVTDQERQLNQLREDNATAERQAAEERRKTNEAQRTWFEQHAVTAFFADHVFGSSNAAAARDVTSGSFTGHLAALAQQATGERPGMGAGAWFSNLGRTLDPWGEGPSFPSTTALDYGNKPAPDFAKGISDLATAGVPAQATLKTLTELFAELNDDLAKGAVNVDDYNTAFGNLAARVTNISDPVQRILTATSASASLSTFTPGYQRGLQGYLRSAGTASASARGVSPDRLALMSPDELESYLSSSDVSRLTGAYRQEYQMQGLDQLVGLRGGMQSAGASASAAGQGGIASLRARVSAEESYKNSLDGGASAATNAAAAILQLNTGLYSFVAAGNAAVGRGAGSAARLLARPLPQHGTTGPAGIVSSAQFDAASLLGYSPADMAAPTSPVVQGLTLDRANELSQQAGGIIAHIQTMIGIEQQQMAGAGQNGGARSVFQLRQATGATQMSREIESMIGAMKAEGSARADVIAKLEKWDGALKDSTNTLIETAKQRAVAETQGQYHRQMGEAQAQLSALGSGRYDPDAIAASKLSQQYQMSSMGGIDPATADKMAKSYVEIDSTIKDTVTAQKDFNSAAQDGVGKIATGIESIVTHSKNWKQALDGVLQSIDQIAMNYFINQPLQQITGSTLQTGSPSLGGTPYGAGGMGVLGALLGGTSGGGSGLIGSIMGAFGVEASNGGGAVGSMGAEIAAAGGNMAYHSGGVVGVDGTPRSGIDPRVFIGAPKLHSGGLLPDEVPAILQRGERVIPRSQASHYGGPVTVTNHFNITTPDVAGFRKTKSQIASEFAREMSRVGGRG